MKSREFKTIVGDKELVAEFTDLADQANGSVIVRYGNSAVLATAVMSAKSRDDIDYFPLTVDYEEKFYAAGQILGSRFMKREGRPSDEAILSGRIIDRTIRPLFNQHFRREVQVVITVLSIEHYDPDILGVIAASLALGTSDIPWDGPVSGIRLGKKKGQEGYMINPGFEFMTSPDFEMEMVVCGKDALNINMIEVGSNEISEEEAHEAMEFAAAELQKIQKFQEGVIKEIGKEKIKLAITETLAEVESFYKNEFENKVADKIFSSKNEVEVKEALSAVAAEWLALISEKHPDFLSKAPAFLDEKINEIVHREAIDNGRRADGRAFDQIRPLFAKAGGISPILHGSGIFYRGGTHVFSALTLGGPQDAQIIDGMEDKQKKRFMHHYNFPPFSSGETGRMGGTNRRMIGHGALAEKALLAVIPDKEKFPYTIRLVSESMASNGSTSMASVCASTLALMDGGVPITRPVAGIAMGLMMNESGYKILTDIQGPEDHHGDMDFKVAGTREGICAIQLDIKLAGVPVKVLGEALRNAKVAREKILDVIEEEIKIPREALSPNAPKIVLLKIKPSQIGLVIGGGGKTINEIKEKTGTEIEIEDDGSVFITGKGDAAEKAREIIAALTKEYAVGEKITGEVVRIADFGAFIKLDPENDGLVHISEIAPFRLGKVTDVLKEGDTVSVIVKGVDERGKISLSIKDVAPDFAREKVGPDYIAASAPHGGHEGNGRTEHKSRGFFRR